jgi:hypothetical protein
MVVAILFAASFVAWFLSMLAGGGSPFILIPLISLLLGAQVVAPVITVGLLVGNTQRGLFFWRQIDWTVTAWYIPGASHWSSDRRLWLEPDPRRGVPDISGDWSQSSWLPTTSWAPRKNPSPSTPGIFCPFR